LAALLAHTKQNRASDKSKICFKFMMLAIGIYVHSIYSDLYQ